MVKMIGTAIAVVVLIGACGGSVSQSPADTAREYALEQSGGETSGCSTAAPGRESENDPGCIYGVAFVGCQDALEGPEGAVEQAIAIRDEFPNEPKLWDVYDNAVRDCLDL